MDELTVNGRPVARYVTEPDVPARCGPRPYLHPVRTLAGTVVTDVLPEDHPHHLGVSVAMQSVAAAGAAPANLWGGRTYVRGTGYTWLGDHGRIEHVAWLANDPDAKGRDAKDRDAKDRDAKDRDARDRDAKNPEAKDRDVMANRMRWCAPDGSVLLEEDRVMAASPVDNDADAWRLDVAYTLTNPGPDPVTLGSPATNGRPGKAGYGGFFWRAAPGRPLVFDPASDDEAEVNGSTGPWVGLVGGSPGVDPYTLIFTGLGDGDHWFVRATEYPGVCVALAFEHTRELAPGASLARRHQILVCDGVRTREQAAGLVSRARWPADLTASRAGEPARSAPRS